MVLSRPTHWGKRVWVALHTLSFMYPHLPSPSEKAAAMSMLQSLSDSMPCAACRKHWKAYIVEHPPTLASRADYSRWLVKAHNVVNARLGKRKMSFRAARTMYDPDKAGVRAFYRAARDVGLVCLAVACVITSTILLERHCPSGK